MRGEVRVKSFTEHADNIAAYGPVHDESGGRSWSIKVTGQARGQVIARLDGVEDRAAAEALKGVRLYVPRGALPAPGDDEYYHADLVGLQGVTNKLSVRPAPGSDEASVQRALFGSAGIASVQGVTTTTDALRDAMAEFTGIFQMIEGVALLLALLIAFNAASISEDERARENATMLAYGIRVRTIMRIAVIESAIIGAIGTALGLVGGWILLRWTVDVLFPRVLPDVRLDAVLTTNSLAIVIALGIVAVAVAPLFTIRKLRRMDIPSTLRVME